MRHVVRRGETLYAIARDRLGDGGRWPEVAAANGGLRPDDLAAGQVLRLP